MFFLKQNVIALSKKKEKKKYEQKLKNKFKKAILFLEFCLCKKFEKKLKQLCNKPMSPRSIEQ